MRIETITGVVFEQWTAQEVAAGLARGEIVLIDVRTPQEYAFEHIPGALLAPMAGFDASALPTQEGKRIVFHCGSGLRSRRVSEICVAAGVDPVAHLEGGFQAWKAANFAYRAVDPASGGMRLVGG